ncbi:MAG: hypothetical protein JSR77_17305 [Planctomycetes bacterium]|nr:hypothetical protein [Planctomycetota bacterium]
MFTLDQSLTHPRALLGTVLLSAASMAPLSAAQIDRTPEQEAMMRASMGPVGTARFHGAQGFLDYANPIPPSAQSPAPLFAFTSDGPEPRSALLDYQSRGQRISLDWDLVNALDEGERVTLPLFDGDEIEIAFARAEFRGPTRYSLFGQIAGVPASEVILVRYDDAVYAVVKDYDRKKVYEIQYAPARDGLGASHVLRKTADTGPRATCGTCGADAAHIDPTPDSPGSSSDSRGGYGPRSQADPADVVDVAVYCTLEARASYANDNAFYSEVQACVDGFNVRCSNSGVSLTLRLMHADPAAAAYHESGDLHTDLGRLQSSADGVMDNLHTLRSLYRADLVVLLRQNSALNLAGLANRPGSVPAVTSAFSVVSRTGNDLGTTFSHEVGHNFGACHDVATGGCDPPSVTGSPRGFLLVCSQPTCDLRWHTTMAYQFTSSCDSSTGISFWSNPSVIFDPPGACNPAAIGDSAANVAGLINLSRLSVSQYNIGSTQVWTNPSFFAGGDGTRYRPFTRMRFATQAVLGGAAEGVVQVLSGTYEETLAGTTPVVLNSACILKSGDGSNAILR